MPLIIASRPHDPLRGTVATIMELEPLTPRPLSNTLTGTAAMTTARLEWIVETAGLTELPLYLQITRELSLKDRLDRLSEAGREEGGHAQP